MAGRKDVLFKAVLFADQDLDALVADMKPPPGPLADAVARLQEGQPGEAEAIISTEMITRPKEIGAWHRLLLAAALSRRGNVPAATRALQKLLDDAPESRLRLWGWQALRHLGVPPAAEIAHRAEGVVVEVDSGKGCETLAAYADGTARYLLPSGARMLWNKPDGRLSQPIEALLTSATEVAPLLAEGRLPGEPASGGARATVLTASGPRAIEGRFDETLEGSSPARPLFAAATALLEQILAIAKW